MRHLVEEIQIKLTLFVLAALCMDYCVLSADQGEKDGKDGSHHLKKNKDFFF